MATSRSYRRDRNKKTSRKQNLPKDPGTPTLGQRGRAGFQSTAGRKATPKRRKMSGLKTGFGSSYGATIDNDYSRASSDSQRKKANAKISTRRRKKP